jgi:hypothetical protein
MATAEDAGAVAEAIRSDLSQVESRISDLETGK